MVKDLRGTATIHYYTSFKDKYKGQMGIKSSGTVSPLLTALEGITSLSFARVPQEDSGYPQREHSDEYCHEDWHTAY